VATAGLRVLDAYLGEQQRSVAGCSTPAQLEAPGETLIRGAACGGKEESP
jgi:hypothetical protein